MLEQYLYFCTLFSVIFIRGEEFRRYLTVSKSLMQTNLMIGV